jgi:uncharacterized protein
MRLDEQRESDQLDDRRGDSGGGGGMLRGGKMGIGGIIAVLAISYFTGINPATLMGLVGGGGAATEETQPAAGPPTAPPANDAASHFVGRVLGSTEDIWTEEFRKLGKIYEKPTLTLFSGSTQTACGQGQAAMGPFYCPEADGYISIWIFSANWKPALAVVVSSPKRM